MKNGEITNIYSMHEFPPISHSIPNVDFHGATMHIKKKKEDTCVWF